MESQSPANANDGCSPGARVAAAVAPGGTGVVAGSPATGEPAHAAKNNAAAAAATSDGRRGMSKTVSSRRTWRKHQPVPRSSRGARARIETCAPRCGSAYGRPLSDRGRCHSAQSPPRIRLDTSALRPACRGRRARRSPLPESPTAAHNQQALTTIGWADRGLATTRADKPQAHPSDR